MSQIEIGRLAMRQEGGNWNAYYADSDSMKDALFLGSVKMNAIIGRPAIKKAFMAVMQEIVSDIIEEATGHRPDWGGEHAAPEHERSGNA